MLNYNLEFLKMSDNKKWIKLIFTTLTHFTVGVPGFEPGTPWSQTRCATGLRYTPMTFVFDVRIWLPSKVLQKYLLF